jgi:hypothetical protein
MLTQTLKKPELMKLYLVGLITGLFLVSSAQAKASSFFGDLGRGIDEGFDSYEQGSADGKSCRNS